MTELELGSDGGDMSAMRVRILDRVEDGYAKKRDGIESISTSIDGGCGS